MVRYRSWLSILSAGVLLVSAGACQQPGTSDVDQTEEGVLRLGSVEAVDTVSRGVDPSGRPLVIDGFRGAIALTGGEASTAALKFVRRGRGENAEEARGVLEDVTISESGGQDAYTYTLDTDGGSYSAVDVTGTVPRDTEVRVKQTKGPVSISGVRGPLDVSHDHGAVTVLDAGSSVDVEIKNGDIRAHFHDLPTDAAVNLQTVNGDVSLELPANAAAQIRAETNAGVIRTTGLPMGKERFTPRDAGGRYTAQIAEGEASVEIETKNGSIVIRAADEAATAPASDDEQMEERSVPPSDTTVLPPSAPGTSSIEMTAPDTSDT